MLCDPGEDGDTDDQQQVLQHLHRIGLVIVFPDSLANIVEFLLFFLGAGHAALGHGFQQFGDAVVVTGIFGWRSQAVEQSTHGRVVCRGMKGR